MFSVQSTVIYTFFGIQSVQNTVFCSVFNALASKNPSIPLSPQTLENIAIYTVFFNFSMFQCRWPTQTYIQKAFKNIVFFTVLLHSFYNVFRPKHRNLHVFRHTVGPKHCFLQCFQCSGIQKPFNSLISPNPWKHRYLHCFLQFFHVPMPLANSNIYTKSIQKHCFLQCFYIAFTMFSVQNTVIYTFFGIQSVQNTVFLQCFQCSGIQTPFKISLFTMFFSFLSVFPFISIPSSSQTPKNRSKKSRKHHLILVSVRNRFCPPTS